jgi:hypothetical protein
VCESARDIFSIKLSGSGAALWSRVCRESIFLIFWNAVLGAHILFLFFFFLFLFILW